MAVKSTLLLLVLVVILAELPRSLSFKFTKTPDKPLVVYYRLNKTNVELRWDWNLEGLDVLNSIKIERNRKDDVLGTETQLFKFYSGDNKNQETPLYTCTLEVEERTNGYAKFVIKDIENQGMNEGRDDAVVKTRVDVMKENTIYVYAIEVDIKSAPKSKVDSVELVVYMHPSFLPSHPSNTYQIIEGQDLKINCTAIGLPTPKITWVNIKGGSVKTQGSGSAVLQIDNIKRYHAGVYECRAKNNPNENAITIRTSVTVYFAPGPVTISITELEASSFTVRWTKPPDDGGLDGTGYLLEVSTKPLVITVNTHAVITGLKANTQYTVKVYSQNAVGYGEVSAKVIRTKTIGKPSIPQLLAALLERKYSKLTVVLRWSKPDDNGGNITRYTIYVKEVKREVDWIKYDDVIDPHEVGFIITNNIVYGKTYKFMVTAWNKYGESVKDEGSAKTVNTTADENTATNAMKYCIEEESTFCLSSAVLGVIIAILVISLGFNLLQFLYLKRRVQLKSRKESPAQKRNTQKEAAAGESYEIDLELEDKTTSAETASHAQQPVQTLTEYETIQQPNPNEAGPSNDTSNYQGLNLSMQGSHGPVYEPLRTRSVEPSMQHNDNEQHPYEPLKIINQNTTYQSLQGNSNDSAI